MFYTNLNQIVDIIHIWLHLKLSIYNFSEEWSKIFQQRYIAKYETRFNKETPIMKLDFNLLVWDFATKWSIAGYNHPITYLAESTIIAPASEHSKLYWFLSFRQFHNCLENRKILIYILFFSFFTIASINNTISYELAVVCYVNPFKDYFLFLCSIRIKYLKKKKKLCDFHQDYNCTGHWYHLFL